MLIRLILIVVVVLIPARTAFPAGDPVPIDSETRTAVVNKVAGLMERHYVFQETGEAMASHIRARLSAGAYDSYGETVPFCRQVTADLREISADKHLFVFHSRSEAREVAARKGLLSPEDTAAVNLELHGYEQESNFGFIRVEVLDGNIGYLRLDAFSGEDDAGARANAAMALLASTQAVIIDLRQNGGGGGSVLPLLASYFFQGDPVPLTGVWYRASGKTEEVSTLPVVAGRRLP